MLKSGLTLFLIRHGETDWNRDSRYQGQRDIDLNDTGRAQASRHGQILKTLMPGLAEYDFVSSPLGRAVETMRIIRKELALPIDDFKVEPQIMELSYGHWEGQLASELPKIDPGGLARKTADPFGWRPMGGESYGDLQARIGAWLQTIERNTVAVTHGGVARVLRGALYDLPPASVPFLEVPQDKILVLRSSDFSWL